MKSTLIFLLLAASCLATSGCVASGPAILRTGTDAQIRSEARRMARADCASGHPRVCLAGTRGLSAVGVSPESAYLVRGLPELRVPRGDYNEPLAPRGIVFAEAYNDEIVRCLWNAQHR